MYAFDFQDWITVRGPQQGSGTLVSITQSEDCWLDLAGYQDIVLWGQISEVSLGGSSQLNLLFQTSATKDETLFVTMATGQIVPGGVGSTGVITVLKGVAVQPLARWVRWQIVPATYPSIGVWDVTFRVFLCANAPGAGPRRPNGVLAARLTTPHTPPSTPLHLQPEGGNNFIYTGGSPGGNLQYGPGPSSYRVGLPMSGGTLGTLIPVEQGGGGQLIPRKEG